jgi:hypothetical protein
VGGGVGRSPLTSGAAGERTSPPASVAADGGISLGSQDGARPKPEAVRAKSSPTCVSRCTFCGNSSRGGTGAPRVSAPRGEPRPRSRVESSPLIQRRKQSKSKRVVESSPLIQRRKQSKSKRVGAEHKAPPSGGRHLEPQRPRALLQSLQGRPHVSWREPAIGRGGISAPAPEPLYIV